MKTLSGNQFKELSSGDLVSIEGSLEIVTHMLYHTFYSAPIFTRGSYQGEPFRKSSHWAGQLDPNDEIIVFNDELEALKYFKNEVKGLKEFYKL